MIVGTTILKKRGNVANARKSANVADQYYRSATVGNSKKDARGLFGRRSGAVAGGNESLAESFVTYERVRKERIELFLNCARYSY